MADYLLYPQLCGSQMRRPEYIYLLARKNEAKRLTEERVVREGEGRAGLGVEGVLGHA